MLYGWMKSLIVYLIFSGLVINLAPSGNFKKYIRLFTGLIAIIILIEPISYIFNFGDKELSSLMSEGHIYENQSQVMGDDEIYDYYDMSLSQAIRIGLKDEGISVSSVSVTTNVEGDLLWCNVITLENDNSSHDKIKSYISQVYNLNIESIYIVRR